MNHEIRLQDVAQSDLATFFKDNVASLQVLEKCGFTICGEDKGFANARGQEIEEYLLRLE